MSKTPYGDTGLPLINVASDYLTGCFTNTGYQEAADILREDLGLSNTPNEDEKDKIVAYVNKLLHDNNDDYRLTSNGTINAGSEVDRKQLLVENLNRLYDVKNDCCRAILRNIRQIFNKNKELVNVPLSNRDVDGVALYTRSPIFWMTSKFDETYILPFLKLLKEFTVNPLIRDSNGNTILMQAIKEGDLPLLENLFLVFGFNEICINPNEDGVDPKLAMFYLAVEMNDNNKQQQRVRRFTNNETSAILNKMFTYLLNAIFTDTSDDNYKLLPVPTSLNHIDINAIIQLYDTKTREVVARATPLNFAFFFRDDTGNIITNDDKIVEYLVKNGADVTDPQIVHAFVETRIPFIYDPPSSNNISETFFGEGGVKSSPSILKILLATDAPVDLTSVKFLEKVLNIPDNKPYVRELEEMLNLLKEAIAIQFILMTPITTNPTLNMTDIEMTRSKFIEDNPDSFDTHTNPYDNLPPLKINPIQTVFDPITLDEINISVFLEEDTENHIVLRNYDNEVTFLVNLKKVRNAIEVHETPEGNLEGGRAIYFPCIGNINGRFHVTTRDVNNMEPYFNMTNVMGVGGGFIPLLEVYSKILNIKPSERGQYFSFKMTGEKIGPLINVNDINYNNNIVNKNRYGHNIDLMSAWHCGDGTTGSVARIVAAEPLTVRVTNLGGSIHSSKSKRRYKYKHTHDRKSIKKHKKTRNRVNKRKKRKITRKLRT